MNWLTGATGRRQRSGHGRPSAAPPSRQAPPWLLGTTPVPLLTAGSCGHSAPGKSARESPTLGSACSRLSGDRTPAHTESLGSRETGSKPSWRREEQTITLEKHPQGEHTGTKGPVLQTHSSHPSLPSLPRMCPALPYTPPRPGL